MVNDSEYFKKRYKLFIRFIKENNLYEEYRRIRENMSVLQNTMLGRRIRTKGQALHMMMVANDVRNYPTRIQIYSDFKMFYIYSEEDVCKKIEKLRPKWKKIVKKLENKQLWIKTKKEYSEPS